MIKITINGEMKTFEEVLPLADLLESLELPDRRIAVELNRRVVKKNDWGITPVCDDDRLEIIHFVGGG